jgi:hypothetical protein
MSLAEAASPILTLPGSRRDALRLGLAGALVGIGATLPSAATLAQVPLLARARVLHAAPELGRVEVLVNGEPKLTEFKYGTTSEWIEIPPGIVRVIIRRNRAGVDTVLFNALAPVFPNEDYYLIISAPEIIPVPVDRLPLSPGSSRVRFIQASDEVPPIDISAKRDQPIVTNLQYGVLSQPVELPAGTYELKVRLHDSGQLLLTVPEVRIEAGTIYDIVAYGTPGNEQAPLTAAVLTDTPWPAVPSATPTAAEPAATPAE